MDLFKRDSVLKALYGLTQGFKLLDGNEKQSPYTELLRLCLNTIEEMDYTTTNAIIDSCGYPIEWFEGEAAYTKDISDERDIWIDIMLDNEEEKV